MRKPYSRKQLSRSQLAKKLAISVTLVDRYGDLGLFPYFRKKEGGRRHYILGGCERNLQRIRQLKKHHKMSYVVQKLSK